MPELSKTPPGPPVAASSAETGHGYAQLTYSSFDDGSGRGGWRIKEVMGDLTPAERDALVERIPTTFDLDPRLPEFPTEAEIEARPARLSYARVGEAGAYWHTVDAGRDATGRPGNVFAHVALDRRPVTQRSERPISRWRSPDWLRPYGAQAVVAAQLPGQSLPGTGPYSGVADTVRFLIGEDVDRQGVFRVLLDSVHSAMTGGPSVILLTDDHDISARWIAAVSWFLPRAVAQELSWSTHDRPDHARAVIGRGTHLVAVPRSAFTEGIRIGDAVVIDDSEEPELGGEGIDHRTSHGTVPVSRFSLLAEGVLVDEDVAVRVLDRKDGIAAEVPVDAAAAVWPLAAAVDEVADLDEFHEEALRAIADDAPDSVTSIPWAAELVTRAQLVHPLSIDQLLTKLRAARDQARSTAVIGTRFLESALGLSEWAGAFDIDLVPDARSVDLAPLRAAITEQVSRLRAQGGVAGSTTVFTEGLLLAEVLHRLGLRGADYNAVLAELDDLLEPADVEVLWGRITWPKELLASKISPTVRSRLLLPRLMAYPREALSEIAHAVWTWLYQDPALLHGSFPVPANPTPVDMRLYPIALVSVLESGTELGDPAPDGVRSRVEQAIDLALESPDVTDDECRSLTRDLMMNAALPVPELIQRTRSHPGRMAQPSYREPVLRGPYSAELFDQMIESSRTPHPPEQDVVSGAVLRRWYRQPEASPMSRENLFGHTNAVLAAGPQWIRVFADDLAIPVCAGFIAAQLAGERWTDLDGAVVHELRTHCSTSHEAISRWLAVLIRYGLVDTDSLVRQSFLYSMDLGQYPATIFDQGERKVEWAEALIDQLVVAGTYNGPNSEEGLRDLAWDSVRDGAAPRAEAFFGNYRKIAKDWLREFRIPRSDSGRRIIRGTNREETR